MKDTRHALRLLSRNKAVAAIAILALALGIGLTTTMFSVVYGVLFRGLPFEESENIVYVAHDVPRLGQEGMPVRAHDFADYSAQQRSFEQLAGVLPMTLSVSGTERADRYSGARITSNLFGLLRVQPLLGRAFTTTDQTAGAEPVAIIGHAMWQNRYGGASDVVGTAIRVNGVPATIVGVMPEGFAFPNNEQIWLPLDVSPAQADRAQGETFDVIGRLRDGTSIDDAIADLNLIARRLELEHPVSNQGLQPVVRPFIDAYVGDEAIGLLLTMLGAVFFVLLIACANVANLLLSRAIVRSKEVGIRTALGASRARVVRQFLTEAVVLSFAGALLGAGIAIAGVQLFNSALEPSRIPFFIDVKIDRIALLFVLGTAVLTALVAGTLPALQASRARPLDVLRDEARGSSSFRLGKASRSLVVVEIALSCGLLVAAGLTTKSITRLRTVDLGFDDSNLFTGVIALPQEAYPDSLVPVFQQRLEQELRTVPGITSLALASSIPGLGGMEIRFALPGDRIEREQDMPRAMHLRVSPGYLQTLGVSVVQGRDFSARDDANAPRVAMINRAFAARYLTGRQPIGQRIRLGTEESPDAWVTVVGIIPDVRLEELADAYGNEAILVPNAQAPQNVGYVLARTATDPLAITDEVRAALARVDADVALYYVSTLPGAIARDTWFYRVFGGLFLVFGVAALILATIGLYGVMAFSVSQRTREVGIRMAVGATARDILRLILKQGLVQVAIGVLFGVALAGALSQMLSAILFDVQPRDGAIFGGVIATLIATALLACIVPARRATGVDPLIALRHE